MFKLELKFKNLTLQECTLQDGDSLCVGCRPENDIVVNDSSVSGLHAHIARKGDDLVLRDVGRRNGILANGVKMQTVQLKDGDIVKFGASHILKVSITAAENTEATITTEHLAAAFSDENFDFRTLLGK